MRVVEHDGDGTKFLDGFGDYPFDIIAFAYFTSQCQCTTALLFNPLGDALYAGQRSRTHCHCGTLSGQTDCLRFAETLASARHDCYLAIQNSHVLFPLSLWWGDLELHVAVSLNKAAATWIILPSLLDATHDSDMRNQNNSADVVLITPERIVANANEGTPADRIYGALVIYVSQNKPLSLSTDDGPTRDAELAIIPPHTRHRVATLDHHLFKVIIEAETVDIPKVIERLSSTEVRRLATASHMREGFKQLAQIAGFSESRFSHLFRAETGASFRDFRTWKHARSFVPFVTGYYNLVDVALQIGYADAPHFSRSIRHVYGVTPTDIYNVSRKLHVVVQRPTPRASAASR